jgi:hypothetical protein
MRPGGAARADHIFLAPDDPIWQIRIRAQPQPQSTKTTTNASFTAE